MYKHTFPALQVFKCNFGVERWLWQLAREAAWSLWLNTYRCVHKHTKSVRLNCLWEEGQSFHVKLVSDWKKRKTKKKTFTLREPECSYSIKALSCCMPAAVEQSDSVRGDLKLGAWQGFGCCGSPSKKERFLPFPLSGWRSEWLQW